MSKLKAAATLAAGDRRQRSRGAGEDRQVSLLTNAVIFHTTPGMMMVVLRELIAEGWTITTEDLAVLFAVPDRPRCRPAIATPGRAAGYAQHARTTLKQSRKLFAGGGGVRSGVAILGVLRAGVWTAGSTDDCGGFATKSP
jgi:hypothetical protein